MKHIARHGHRRLQLGVTTQVVRIGREDLRGSMAAGLIRQRHCLEMMPSSWPNASRSANRYVRFIGERVAFPASIGCMDRSTLSTCLSPSLLAPWHWIRLSKLSIVVDCRRSACQLCSMELRWTHRYVRRSQSHAETRRVDCE